MWKYNPTWKKISANISDNSFHKALENFHFPDEDQPQSLDNVSLPGRKDDARKALITSAVRYFIKCASYFFAGF